MAKPNYAFAKRQRDLAKKRKKEEKKLRKAAISNEPSEADGSPEDADKPDALSKPEETGQATE